MAKNNHLKNPIKASPDEMSNSIQKLKVIYDWPSIDLDSDEEVAERINLYFEYTGEAGIRPTVEGLALAIGVDRRTIWDWEVGNSRAQVGSSRSDIIKKAKDFIALLVNQAALDNKIYPATWIFYAKNYFGMKDTQEIEVRGHSKLDQELSAEEIAKRLPDSIPIDVDYSEE